EGAGPGAGVDAVPAAGLAELLGPPATLRLAGRDVPVLTVEQQLVAAAAEVAADGAPPLVRARDPAQLALSPALDAAAARRSAEATGTAAALAAGIARVWSWFDLADKTELSVWALRMTSGPRDRRPLRPPPPGGRSGIAQRVLGRRQPASGPARPGRPAAPP